VEKGGRGVEILMGLTKLALSILVFISRQPPKGVNIDKMIP